MRKVHYFGCIIEEHLHTHQLFIYILIVLMFYIILFANVTRPTVKRFQFDLYVNLEGQHMLIIAHGLKSKSLRTDR